jgi:hypothetical protein
MELHAAAAIQLVSASAASPAVLGNCVLAVVFMVILVAVPLVVVFLVPPSESNASQLFRVMFEELREGVVVSM